jgi:hypothetical protein
MSLTWVHLDPGSKLDGHATEARWVGFNGDSMHAHHIYWQDTNRVSIEQDVLQHCYHTHTSPFPFRHHHRQYSTSDCLTQSQLTSVPAATDRGEEEIPDEDKAH